jgi:phosphoribosyl-AMP cyclohydrolase
MTRLIDAVKFNSDGLVPAIAQCVKTKDVLMMAWMNAEALELTVKEKRAVYFSRSRQTLWRKGESSGNIQRLHNIRLDCDGDTVLLLVEQVGGVACHTGRSNCFYKTWQDNDWLINQDVIKDPKSMYND